jgi:integrase
MVTVCYFSAIAQRTALRYDPSMDIGKLLQNNRKPRQQKGEIIETSTAFLGRYYYTAEDGSRKQKAVTLARKSDLYRSRSDVQPLMDRLMADVNSEAVQVSGRATLTEFVEDHYLPWVRDNKAAATHDGYRKLWQKNLRPHIGKIALADLTTTQVTGLLTKLAQDGFGARSLSHIKWFLSGAYEHAVATGIVPANPVQKAKWLKAVESPAEMMHYSLEQVLAMLRILEPLDLRAAVAVGLAYFAGLRPAEIRGLQWPDVGPEALHVRRKVWRKDIGKLKTERSAGMVPLIEPLRSLLDRHRGQSADGFILQNSAGKPLDLDSLNTRVIAPALKGAGIVWAGFYPARRGISSLVAAVSNPLTSSGVLRNSLAVNLKHYQEPSAESKSAAMRTIEEMATKPEETIQ